jgi:hypothetical protein
MPQPQLPMWVSYLQALAVPVIAVVVAAFGTWIAALAYRFASARSGLVETWRQEDSTS